VTPVTDTRARRVQRIIMADPRKYRDEVERLRKEAAKAVQGNHKTTLLQIAQLYDALADGAEKRRPRRPCYRKNPPHLQPLQFGDLQPRHGSDEVVG